MRKPALTHRTVQYGTVQYSTVQYSTVRYSTVRYSTVQYGTVQYGTVQYSTVRVNSEPASQLNLGYLRMTITASMKLHHPTEPHFDFSMFKVQLLTVHENHSKWKSNCML